MKSFDLNLLHALDALLATSSVTLAAQRVHLSTPAMSHTLARIRELLGDPILVRAGRKLVPTPRALALVEPVRRLLADARALVEPMTDEGLARVKRQFVIRAPDGVAVIYGAALSVAMMDAMPAASLRFLPESHADAGALREGRIDLDMGSLRLKDPEAEWEVLQTQGWFGAARNGHPLLDGKLTARRLATERHVAIAVRPDEVSPVDEAFIRLGHPRFIALTVPNAYGALVTIAQSPLVGCVPARIARAMHEPLGITLFELPFPVTGDPFVMAWHPRQAADRAHLWLRQAIRQALDDPRWQMPKIGPVAAASPDESFVRRRRPTVRP